LLSRKVNLNVTVVGLSWVVLAGVNFVGFVVLIKYVGSELPPVQAAFIRYLFGFVVLLPLFIRNGTHIFDTKHIHLHGLRGFIQALAVMLWFYAVTKLPIAEVTALGFVSPIFVVFGAVFFLRERMNKARIAAVVLGLVGVFVILRPGFSVINSGSVAMLLAAPLFAASKVLTKYLVKHDSGATIVVYLSVFAALTMAIPAISVWTQPSGLNLLLLAGTALFATMAHLCMARGLALIDVTVSQPVDFLQLVWSTLIGIMLFSETPVVWIWIGGGIVVVSASYIARFEVKRTY
jgi:drug/metabolite transporter (DMT)-like permease